MKSFTAIGFLILLLYHLIGLPLAVLTFDETYQSATPISSDDHWKLVKLPISLPYTASWENPDGLDGLVQDGDNFYNIVHQRYANDTLYTLLKTNQNARDRFFDLADQLQQFSTDQEASQTPLSRLLKLLKERLTTYLLPSLYRLTQPLAVSLSEHSVYGNIWFAHYGVDQVPNSPPPQQ
ncbi:hypothetical protein WBJ53_21755 [Spirosoma sp. SC4-14]|uniref:hypothetical protein n=1 Tax=Spirosoma sp. SC4-14 TaxID=3128900 RepID=UPI0030D4B94C